MSQDTLDLMLVDPLPLLGRRVSLRHRMGSRDGRPLYSDAVGVLERDGERWVVHTRRGPVRVDPERVRAVREVPPARPRRAPLAAIVEVERACARAWPPQVVEPLGDWLLRAAGGFTLRANSALVIGDPGMPVPDALDRAVAFADRYGIVARATVPQATPWEAPLERAGWVPGGTPDGGEQGGAVSVQVAPLRGLLGAPVAGGVTLDAEPAPEWWPLVGAPGATAVHRAVLAGPGVGFGVARVDGAVVGAVRAAVADGWLHLARLAICPAHRRRGLGRALTLAAARWAAERGAHSAMLQMLPHNTAAGRLYAGLGFTEHHTYRIWNP